tara:strand:- start:319 stop:963 length:645 start_codon:yes stop_codon:yes gene_type:complete
MPSENNTFVNSNSPLKGEVHYTVKNPDGEERYTGSGGNGIIGLETWYAMTPLFSENSDWDAGTAATSVRNMLNMYDYRGDDFNTKQTVWSTDGGVGGNPGIAVYSTRKEVPSLIFAGTNGTLLNYLAVDYGPTPVLTSDLYWNLSVIGTGSFLSSGTCSYFEMGFGWHNTKYTGNSIERGFANMCQVATFNPSSFEYSSGDTITVSWVISATAE